MTRLDRNKRFSGKVCLVTGGSHGLGLAAAQGFASEGAQVMTQYQTQVWRYNAGAKLLGENILANPVSRTFWKMKPTDVRAVAKQFVVLEAQYQEAIQLPQYRKLLAP